ncbi:MarR family transcriptional regulator [Alkalibacterium iburiense]|uniref:MarR family transcriptional regulator n=1 Tax=Alkalibacterium iburiense TaxID=290589 RepID=A0ABN0X852_9LACT
MEYLMRYISRTSRLSELYRNEKLKEYGLGGIHHTYILNICRHPGVTQDELADLIFVNKSNVTRQLAILEKKGYVNRQPSPSDKRKLLVYPTAKTKAVYPEVVKVLKEWNQIILKNLSEEEQAIVGNALKNMMSQAKEAVEQTN